MNLLVGDFSIFFSVKTVKNCDKGLSVREKNSLIRRNDKAVVKMFKRKKVPQV